jgi:OOP family OmpA-OmpF porin
MTPWSKLPVPKLPMLGALTGVLLLAASASAQEGGFALNQLQPSPAGDTFHAVPSPYAAGHVELRGYLMFDYAHRPIRRASDDVAIVSAQGFMRADLSFALWDRLLISADMPVSMVQSGEAADTAGIQYIEADAPQAGDLRLGLRGRLWGDDASAFQIGLGGYFFAPTGKQEQYAGDGASRGSFHLPLGGRIGSSELAFVYSVAGGIELRASDSPHAITYGVGAAVALADDMVQLGPELYGVTPLGGEVTLAATPLTKTDAGTNLELLVGGKLRFLDGLTLGVGAGPGLLSAIGTPTIRALASLGWAPVPEAPAGADDADDASKQVDRDGDGTPDELDACPEEPGEPNADKSKDGCPPPDRDGDGVLDMEDACPTTPGLASGDATQNGCPEDTDGDTFHDGIDACPKRPGDASDDPARLGCPADRDGDGIVDTSDSCPDAAGAADSDPHRNGCPADPDNDGIEYAADACPLEKGQPDSDPKQNGCPRFVRVKQGEIVITQKVEFNSGGGSLKEVVSKNSEVLLSEVSDAIKQHPEIKLLEVQGHTDDDGNEEFNQQLSQRRADVVRTWLVDHGIDGSRLSAKGYGFTRPVADNRIRTGRQRNRRVQFVILKSTKRKP